MRAKLTAIAIAALPATEAAGAAPEGPHAALAARGHLPKGRPGAELGIARMTGCLERVFRAARAH